MMYKVTFQVILLSIYRPPFGKDGGCIYEKKQNVKNKSDVSANDSTGGGGGGIWEQDWEGWEHDSPNTAFHMY